MSNFVQNEKNKHYLMLCELHYPPIHGKNEDSDPFIENHYLVYDRFDPKTGLSYSCFSNNEFINDNNLDDNELNDNEEKYNINDVLEFLKEHYSNQTNFPLPNFENHPTIRNYRNIISRSNYIKPEIGEYIILPTQEAIAILKTVWLRIIQRKWKKVFAERQNIITKHCLITSLQNREIHNKYIQMSLPGLKGMLNKLKYNS